MQPKVWFHTSRLAAVGLGALFVTACDASTVPARQVAERTPVSRPTHALSDSDFATLVARVSEPGGYFDTDNLISNERGYLKVLGAMDRLGVTGGAYVGVGPDQNFSYIAQVAPVVAFITDIRRDNMLHHLLLKALIERAPTRVEFLAGLHGREPPESAAEWRSRPVSEVVDYMDQADRVGDMEALRAEVTDAVVSYGVPLSAEDLETIRRFHGQFIDQGLSLRFTSYGRAPRPYYPTYRQLTVETDLDGRPASYLATAEAYVSVRDLHLENRIIPVVGDLAGPHGLKEMGAVMREMGVRLTAFYTSNVEFYLWRNASFGAWVENLGQMPTAENAVVIRSYFPNFGGAHPSAVSGYYATQTLQPVRTLLAGGFTSYWDVVTRGSVSLR
jgi:hypothetical protein